MPNEVSKDVFTSRRKPPAAERLRCVGDQSTRLHFYTQLIDFIISNIISIFTRAQSFFLHLKL
jgi:hypothetical protein